MLNPLKQGILSSLLDKRKEIKATEPKSQLKQLLTLVKENAKPVISKESITTDMGSLFTAAHNRAKKL